MKEPIVKLTVRGIPAGLRQRAKAAAALRDQTLETFLREAIEAAVKAAEKGGKR